MLWRGLSVLLLIFSLALPPHAHAGDAVVIVTERSGAYGDFAEALRKSLEGSNWRVQIVTPDRLASEAGLRNAEYWIAAGTEASRLALQNGATGTLLATLLPRSSYEKLLSEVPARPRGGVVALVLDQPVGRQLALIQQLFPSRKRVGLLTGPETRAMLTRTQQSAGASGLALEAEDAADDTAVVPAANRLLARSDVLLALPDSLVYSRNNVRPILLASYRYQRPVIGYSPAFATAGALAALYSTPTQISRQVADLLLSGRKPAQPILYPEKFSVSFNRQVAQSLGIELPEEAAILRALESARAEP